jgi:uncharacterized membrane protein
MKPDLAALLVATSVTVGGQVIYHVITRTVGPSRNPFELIATAYLFAFLLVVVVGVLNQQISLANTLSQATLIPAMGIGLAVSLVEIGYVFAYKFGLPINTGALSVLAVTTVVLAPLGLFYFGESLSLRLVLGAILTIVGVWLMRT